MFTINSVAEIFTMKNQSNQTTPISEPNKDGFSQFSQVLEDCRRAKEQKIDGPKAQKQDISKADEDEDYTRGKSRKKETKGQDSRCCNFFVLEGQQGVVGILEGFGLLGGIGSQNKMSHEEDEAAFYQVAGMPITDDTESLGNINNQAIPKEGIAEKDTNLGTKPIKVQSKPMDEKGLTKGETPDNNRAYDGELQETDETVFKDPPKAFDQTMDSKDGDEAKLGQGLAEDPAKDAGKDLGKDPGGNNISAFTSKIDIFSTIDSVENGIEAGDSKPIVTAEQMDENIKSIVDSLTARPTEDGQECTISLKPEHLGRLRIHLTMDKAGIKALIQAEDSAVSRMIREQTDHLKGLLEEKGVNITSMEVGHESFMANQDNHQQQNWNRKPQGQPQKPIGGYRETLISDEKIAGPALGSLPNPRRSPYSSVEFMA